MCEEIEIDLKEEDITDNSTPRSFSEACALARRLQSEGGFGMVSVSGFDIIFYKT